MLLLNHQRIKIEKVIYRDLHFNMLLLNRTSSSLINPIENAFTFQYASIKPRVRYPSMHGGTKFTFQYASIKPVLEAQAEGQNEDLHFNMLLLNPKERRMNTVILIFTFQYASIKPLLQAGHFLCLNSFTFQYASIKPKYLPEETLDIVHLHFNMLLLNRYPV